MKQKFTLISLFCFCFLCGFIVLRLLSLYIVDNRPPHLKNVEVQIYAGLGNNMFQYAVGLAYALEHDKNLYITGKTSNLFHAFNHAFWLSSPDNPHLYSTCKQNKCPDKGIAVYDDTPYHMDNQHYTYFFGYFQHEKYFKKYRNEIIQAFQFKKPTDEKNKKLIEQIQSTNAVALHIRRGDYLHQSNAQHVLSLHYYKHAIKYISERVPNPHFYIFSNDIKWAKKHLKLSHPHTFISHNTGKNSYLDMYLMTLCKHNIIANSTFSWWGAYLNQNPNKIVISPDIWLKTDKQFIKNIVPSEWVQLPGKASVGILYLDTGRYTIFFDEFYKTMEKNFLPQDNKTYYVWTDSARKFPKNVVKIPTKHPGWPQIVLNKYLYFHQQWQQLQKHDYLFHMNANIIVADEIQHEIIPSPQQKITALWHPVFYKHPHRETYEHNPKSTAYIPKGQGKYYFAGGFYGGTSDGMKDLIETCLKNTQTDEKNNIMAVWHDESHLNKYLLDKDPLILSPQYLFPQNGTFMNSNLLAFKDNYKILLLNKSNYGGHHYLRQLTDEKNP